ncbi:MAG: hypothetical protein HUU20_00500 [Pirellulales bacterium]|nr:hypothetical protein [Pirellulales bacterium]
MDSQSVERPGNQGQPEVVRADPRLRRRAVLLVCLLALSGLAILWLLQARLGAIRELAETDLDRAISRAVGLIRVIASIAALSFLGMAVWFGRLSWQIQSTGQYPPPGTKVIRDTLVRTGHRARRLGNLAMASAMFFVAIGTVGMWYMYSLAVAVLEGR